MPYLYAVQMLIPNYIHPIKIGTSNSAKRLGAYTTLPFPILCLGMWRGNYQDERAAHAKFAEHRLCGEWFYPDPDLLLFIQHKTGLVRLQRKRTPDSRSFRRLLGRVEGCEHEEAVNAVISKAREVMARFRTVYLSDHDLMSILEIPPQALRDLRNEGIINHQPDARYYLEDVVNFLIANPDYAAHSPWRNWREVDKRLYTRI